jgi:hypothetical protein
MTHPIVSAEAERLIDQFGHLRYAQGAKYPEDGTYAELQGKADAVRADLVAYIAGIEADANKWRTIEASFVDMLAKYKVIKVKGRGPPPNDFVGDTALSQDTDKGAT